MENENEYVHFDLLDDGCVEVYSNLPQERIMMILVEAILNLDYDILEVDVLKDFMVLNPPENIEKRLNYYIVLFMEFLEAYRLYNKGENPPDAISKINPN